MKTNLFGESLIRLPTLADNFIVPPFSTLNAREGVWQGRKKKWISMGIKSEVGRGEDLLALAPASAVTATAASRKAYRNKQFGTKNMAFDGGAMPYVGHKGRRPHSGSLDERAGREPGIPYAGGDAWVASDTGSGTSIFDPVLCELLYLWFSARGSQVVDPFAGGSVRGIVAHALERKYWGCDLRAVQIKANKAQAQIILPKNKPSWVCGDTRDKIKNAPQADFLFSCPPYGNLEKYSDDPLDLSTMEYADFIKSYQQIIGQSVAKLHDNRFACFVVGDFRDKAGNYRNFVSDTIDAFRQHGMHLYNECILITCIGSLPIRIGKQFTSGRKLGKTHQNVLVFVKGNGQLAAQYCGKMPKEYEDPTRWVKNSK